MKMIDAKASGDDNVYKDELALAEAILNLLSLFFGVEDEKNFYGVFLRYCPPDQIQKIVSKFEYKRPERKKNGRGNLAYTDDLIKDIEMLKSIFAFAQKDEQAIIVEYFSKVLSLPGMLFDAAYRIIDTVIQCDIKISNGIKSLYNACFELGIEALLWASPQGYNIVDPLKLLRIAHMANSSVYSKGLNKLRWYTSSRYRRKLEFIYQDDRCETIAQFLERSKYLCGYHGAFSKPIINILTELNIGCWAYSIETMEGAEVTIESADDVFKSLSASSENEFFTGHTYNLLIKSQFLKNQYLPLFKLMTVQEKRKLAKVFVEQYMPQLLNTSKNSGNFGFVQDKPRALKNWLTMMLFDYDVRDLLAPKFDGFLLDTSFLSGGQQRMAPLFLSLRERLSKNAETVLEGIKKSLAYEPGLPKRCEEPKISSESDTSRIKGLKKRVKMLENGLQDVRKILVSIDRQQISANAVMQLENAQKVMNALLSENVDEPSHAENKQTFFGGATCTSTASDAPSAQDDNQAILAGLIAKLSI